MPTPKNEQGWVAAESGPANFWGENRQCGYKRISPSDLEGVEARQSSDECYIVSESGQGRRGSGE